MRQTLSGNADCSYLFVSGHRIRDLSLLMEKNGRTCKTPSNGNNLLSVLKRRPAKYRIGLNPQANIRQFDLMTGISRISVARGLISLLQET